MRDFQKFLGINADICKTNAYSVSFHSILVIILVWLSRPITCQNHGGSAAANNAARQYFSQFMSGQISNLSTKFGDDISHRMGFCIMDWQDDWNQAFNFSKDLSFIEACAKQLGEKFFQRVCTLAEIKLYFMGFFESGGLRNLQPNKNCNMSSWVSGCEPGWSCDISAADKDVDFKSVKDLPPRTTGCKPCCEGFFCPRGLTCMIPCPLGAYCPMAKANSNTGICEPYGYQLPPGNPNHTCGGADIWADVRSSNQIFCTAGAYCPSTVKKLDCSRGHFCRIGSTLEEKCLSLATCEPNSQNQNITAYGIMVFVGLFLLLILIYNCSDQVISTRVKKKAKSREKAVQSVQETLKSREKWRTAKDIAKKHAIGLQTQITRTFSKRKSKSQEQLKIFNQTRPESDAALPPIPPSTSGKSEYQQSKGMKKGKGNLTKMMDENENGSEQYDEFNVEISDRNTKKNAPKTRHLHTQSQIFKYAYGQIEMEKALAEQTKNHSFSGVVSMANSGDLEMRKRPTIEITFKDLTLTLKGKKKHLLRCVSGKLFPGRVSAVMGPSGAGKTTFLSALMGKATSCSMTGTILVNGKTNSITCYRKIIGFVPQDDIVHGNLTVEENLWFSARCRLSADLPKPEKVLVVERVIESLGLQAVRNSLVGTVEKRGVSGGQKKRVNVGLEMVMEPSLLILDEPTSGLDSSSSQLLLRALRREATEGVNVCMVVHQPRMFDDFILLAKGGLTVYHGPAKKVEEYFECLGITVPERVNPPDYFIDILEGIVKPSTSTGVTYKQLPVRWMLHNGYSIPPDMLESLEEKGAPPDGGSSPASSHGIAQCEEQSQSGDFGVDLKSNKSNAKIRFKFLRFGDLSNRKTPGAFQQYKYFLGRVSKQRLRDFRTQCVDYLILLLAGVCLGTIAKVSDENFGALGYTYTVIGVSLLCKIVALRSFQDKLHYWRESASGMSSLAYFCSKDTVDLFNILLKPMLYLSMFYFFNNPRSSLLDNYVVLFCLVYCVTGIAYVLAILFEAGPAQLWSVLLPVVLTLVATQSSDNLMVSSISKYSFPKWALEAFVVANAKRYYGVWLITRCGALMKYKYSLSDFTECLFGLILFGLATRVVAFICLIIVQKK